MSDSLRENHALMSDADLVEVFLMGNPYAFTEIVRRHSPAMLSRIRTRVGSQSEHQDLLQEMFLIAYKQLRTLKEPERLGAWLGRIADNLSVEWQRRRYVQSTLIGFFPEESVDPGETQDHDPFVRAAVGAAFRALSQAHREVVFHHYGQGISYEETAGLLGIPTDLVRSRLQKARLILKKKLENMKKNTYQDIRITIAQSELKLLTSAARFCYVHQPDRPALRGILLDQEHGCIVATDGRRILVRNSSWVERLHGNFVLGECVGLELPATGEGLLAVGMTEATLEIGGHIAKVFPMPPDLYPKYRQALLAVEKDMATVDGEKLRRAVQRFRREVSVVPQPGIVLLRLESVESELVLRLSNPETDTHAEKWTLSVVMPVEKGAILVPFSIDLNLTYLEDALDGLSGAPDGKLDVQFDSTLKFGLRWSADPLQQAVIMPVVSKAG